MESNDSEKQAGPEQRRSIPSFDEYFNMDEQEKDRAIEQSVLRLQNRVRQIRYLMEIEDNPVGKPSPAAEPNNHFRKAQ